MNLNIQNSWPHWSSTYDWQFSTCNCFHGEGIGVRGDPILLAAVISLSTLHCLFHPTDPFAKPSPQFSVCYSGNAKCSWKSFLNVHSICHMALPPCCPPVSSPQFPACCIKDRACSTKKEIKQTCFHLVMHQQSLHQYIIWWNTKTVLHLLHKMQVHTPILIWILAFCICSTLFFLL